MMILIGELRYQKESNKYTIITKNKVVPRAIRPLLDVCSFFIFKEVICMDSDYYYYRFEYCNLINYTNYLGGNKNGKRFI